MIILTRDESPLVYRGLVVLEDSNFDLSTALFHVTMYRQFARKVDTSANSALIRYYNCLARLALARERTPIPVTTKIEFYKLVNKFTILQFNTSCPSASCLSGVRG